MAPRGHAHRKRCTSGSPSAGTVASSPRNPVTGTRRFQARIPGEAEPFKRERPELALGDDREGRGFAPIHADAGLYHRQLHAPAVGELERLLAVLRQPEPLCEVRGDGAIRRVGINKHGDPLAACRTFQFHVHGEQSHSPMHYDITPGG